MKKLIHSICFVLLSIGVHAQTCLPGGINFTSQAQIDAFPTDFPGCTQIIGDVTIDDLTSNNINNLNGLSSVTSIGGHLYIWDNDALLNLTGLDALTSVSANIDIRNNATLTGLAGLGNLTTIVGSFAILNNPAMTTLTGLGPTQSISSLVIDNNDALTSLTGLGALTNTIGGIAIDNNANLVNLTGLGALTSVGGNIDIINNASLTSLIGLEGLTTNNPSQDINITDNPVLSSLTGLGSLTSLGGGLLIKNNAILTSLAALNGITIIGGYLNIQGNPLLTSLSGLDALTTVDGYALYIHNNATLASFSGLNALMSVDGYVDIGTNPVLTSLTALFSLSSINGDLIIQNNATLTSLSGLDNINPAGITNLKIQSSNLLSFCEVQSICDYLDIPSNPATISGNATGCATRAEVEAACLPLPIELITFYGTSKENHVILSWTTSSESNNKYFQIEHSQDGSKFDVIGTEQGQGSSTEQRSYTYIDPNPVMGVNYYRLNQVDFDGKNEYSKSISVNIDSKKINLYPNPTLGIIMIQGKEHIEGTLRLSDNFGRLLDSYQLLGVNELDIGHLPNGTYFIQIVTDLESTINCIVKE